MLLLNKHILFLLIFIFINIKADYLLELKDSQSVYSIGKGVLFLEDKEGSYSVDDLSEMESQFQGTQEEELNFGFSSSVYWFKIPIEVLSENSSKQWWLDIDYTLLEDIHVYQDIGGELHLILNTGNRKSFEHRPIKWRSYSTILDTSSASTLYVRVQTQSSMQVPMKIYSSDAIVSAKQAETLFSGFFYGVILLIIFYNAFLFFVWSDKNYLYYILFITSFLLWQLNVDGFAHQYLWPEVQWLREKGVLIFVGLTVFNALLFTRSFLRLSEYAKGLNKVLVFLQVFMSVLILGSFVLSYTVVIQILAWVIVAIPFILLYAGAVALKHKYKYARFYIVGWSIFLGATIIFTLNKLGLIGGYEHIKYFQQIGSIAEVIFFSLALAERINTLRRQNIKNLSALNSRLRSEVHDKSSQIREKDELLIQQSRLASMGEMLENISHQWKQPLHKLSLVIQNHYFKHKMEGVSADDLESFNEHSTMLVNYMSTTVDDFRNFFDPQKEKELFGLNESVEKVLSILSSSLKEEKIEIVLAIKSREKVAGYPNEFGQVLLNLFSNARDALLSGNIEEKKIEISVDENEDSIVLAFLDNAGGIPQDILPKIFDPYFSTKGLKKGSGIGLYMSKMIIENSMNGSFHVRNSTVGAEFTITLAKVL